MIVQLRPGSHLGRDIAGASVAFALVGATVLMAAMRLLQIGVHPH